MARIARTRTLSLLVGASAAPLALGALSGCGAKEETRAITCAPTAVSGSYTLSGTIEYDYVQALDSTQGGPKLGYTHASAAPRPARRVVVQAVDECGTARASANTADDGTYSLSVSGYK